MFMRASRYLALFVAVIVWQSPEAAHAAKVFGFSRVSEDVYYLTVNSRQARLLDFTSGADVVQTSISCKTLRTRFDVAGACDDIANQWNRDLQNNAFRDETHLNFEFARDFVDGAIRPSYTPGAPRPVFDFRRVFDRQFDLYINDIYSRTFDMMAQDSTTFQVTLDDLRSQFGLGDRDLFRLIDREFGNEWTSIDNGNAFEIDVTRFRMAQSGDTLFFFDQVRERHFRLYINGRKSKWIDLNRIDRVAGDPFFDISAKTLAARYGLIGPVQDVIDQLRLNGIDVQLVDADDGSVAFRFIVDADLFEFGGTRTVTDTTFIVRRNLASRS